MTSAVWTKQARRTFWTEQYNQTLTFSGRTSPVVASTALLSHDSSWTRATRPSSPPSQAEDLLACTAEQNASSGQLSADQPDRRSRQPRRSWPGGGAIRRLRARYLGRRPGGRPGEDGRPPPPAR